MTRGPRRWWVRKTPDTMEPADPLARESVRGHVFISYAHGPDRAYVDRLAQFLTVHGIPTWYDPGIVVGDRWKRAIPEKIDTCAAFVVVMTPRARRSDWVSREINQAERTNRPMFPLLLDGEVFFDLNDIQSEDVAGGRMPGPSFVDRLRELLVRSGEHQTARPDDEHRRDGAGVWLIPAPEDGLTARPELADDLITRLTAQSAATVGVSTALYGAGGFGKPDLGI